MKKIILDGQQIIVYQLPQKYKDYLDKVTFEKPVISKFVLLDDSLQEIDSSYELGSQKQIFAIKHCETNIDNIDGSLKFDDTQLVTPSDIEDVFNLDEPLIINNTKQFELTGIDIMAEQISKTVDVSFDRYAYSNVTDLEETPTTGTKMTEINTFSVNGSDFNYNAGDYIYLYTNKENATAQIYTLEQWTDVETENLGKISFTQENGVEYNYDAYRIGPFITSGSDKYRI